MGLTQENLNDSVTPLDLERRDAWLHELGALHAAGELSLDDLEARISEAMAARSAEELDALVHKLPPHTGRAEQDSESKSPGQVNEDSAATPNRARETNQYGRLLAVAAVVVAAGGAAGALLSAPLLQVLAGVGGALAVYHVLRRYREPSVRPSATDGRPDESAAEAAPSRELVVAPRPQMPAQRVPDKVHPVLVNDGREAADLATTDWLPPPQKLIVPSVRELPHAERIALRPGRVGTSSNADSHNLPVLTDQVVARQGERVRDMVAHLRPLLHRVTDRARIRQHVRRGQAPSRIRSS